MWNDGRYVLKQGWAKEHCTEKLYNTLKTLDREQRSLPASTVWSVKDFELDFINSQKLIELVKKHFNLHPTSIKIAVSAITDKDCGLPLHNDYKNSIDNNIICRGILYLNPIKRQGTYIHGEVVEEVGGDPGDLFLFVPTPKSFHSTGFVETEDIRFVANIMFYK